MPAGRRLWTQNLQPHAVIEELVRHKVPIGYLAEKITGSHAFRHFVEGAPGLKETALLGHAYRLVQGGHRPRVECVVIDAPATGHGAALLAAPALLAEAAQGGQVGAMAAELAAFLADPARCAVVLATLAEEMPVQETLELLELLESRMGLRPELVVANALYPCAPLEGPGEALELLRERRAMNEAELARLRAAWDGPMVELPLLAIDRGPALLAALLPAFSERGT